MTCELRHYAARELCFGVYIQVRDPEISPMEKDTEFLSPASSLGALTTSK